MQLLSRPRFGMLLAVILTLSAMTLGVSFGQSKAEPGQPVLQAQKLSSAPLAAVPQTAAATAPAQATQSIYLPLIYVPYNSVQFSEALNANGVPVNPRSRFAYGIKDLSISTLVGKMPNVSYRLVVIAPNGAESSSPFSGSRDQFYAIVQICLPTGLTCDSGTKSPLPRGTYTGQLFVNDELVRQDSAVIQ